MTHPQVWATLHAYELKQTEIKKNRGNERRVRQKTRVTTERMTSCVSPQHHGTDSVSWGPGRARLSAEELGLRSLTAVLRVTLEQSTQEHHLKNDKASEPSAVSHRARMRRRWTGVCRLYCYTVDLCIFILEFRVERNWQRGREKTHHSWFIPDIQY